MRVLVVENMVHSDLGQVGVALDEAGAEIDLRRPFTGEALPADIHAHDALVVLGGDQSAVDDHIHPYLPELARLMRAFADADKAVLGICLGSQILARAHGAENLLGRTREFGWHQVELTSEGLSDPVLAQPAKPSRASNGIPTASPCQRVRFISPPTRLLPTRPSASAVRPMACSFISRPERPSSRDGTEFSKIRSWISIRIGWSAIRSMPRATPNRPMRQALHWPGRGSGRSGAPTRLAMGRGHWRRRPHSQTAGLTLAFASPISIGDR